MATRISSTQQQSPAPPASGGTHDASVSPVLGIVDSPAATLRAITAAQGFVTLTKIVPFGSLQARRARDGAVTFYWRVNITVDGVLRQRREMIGRYDPALPPKSRAPNGNRYSLAAALRAAEDLAEAHAAKRRDGGIVAIREAERDAGERAKADAALDATHTLSKLMWDYADHLKRANRPSHRQVCSTIRRHIDPLSNIARKPARLVTPDEIADVMRAAHESGKTRTANKVRSYIRAAYEVAKSARIDATVSASFKAYGIKTNPAAETRVVDASNGKPRTIRALSLDQLRIYWRLLAKVEGLRGAMLRFDLLTGGQRLDQLCRLAPEDIQADRITIYDGKGKRRVLRPHVVPLIPVARKELAACATLNGPFAFTTDGGETHVNGTTLSGWMNEAIATASDDDRKALAGYTARHIRSGIETALAGAGVSKEVRGRLQSHGISGVQDVHYNAHDFMNEKRHALEMLYGLLNSRPKRPRAGPRS